MSQFLVRHGTAGEANGDDRLVGRIVVRLDFRRVLASQRLRVRGGEFVDGDWRRNGLWIRLDSSNGCVQLEPGVPIGLEPFDSGRTNVRRSDAQNPQGLDVSEFLERLIGNRGRVEIECHELGTAGQLREGLVAERGIRQRKELESRSAFEVSQSRAGHIGTEQIEKGERLDASEMNKGGVRDARAPQPQFGEIGKVRQGGQTAVGDRSVAQVQLLDRGTVQVAHAVVADRRILEVDFTQLGKCRNGRQAAAADLGSH